MHARISLMADAIYIVTADWYCHLDAAAYSIFIVWCCADLIMCRLLLYYFGKVSFDIKSMLISNSIFHGGCCFICFVVLAHSNVFLTSESRKSSSRRPVELLTDFGKIVNIRTVPSLLCVCILSWHTFRWHFRCLSFVCPACPSTSAVWWLFSVDFIHLKQFVNRNNRCLFTSLINVRFYGPSNTPNIT